MNNVYSDDLALDTLESWEKYYRDNNKYFMHGSKAR